MDTHQPAKGFADVGYDEAAAACSPIAMPSLFARPSARGLSAAW